MDKTIKRLNNIAERLNLSGYYHFEEDVRKLAKAFKKQADRLAELDSILADTRITFGDLVGHIRSLRGKGPINQGIEYGIEQVEKALDGKLEKQNG
jgi:hypothetical protein